MSEPAFYVHQFARADGVDVQMSAPAAHAGQTEISRQVRRLLAA